MCSVVFSLARFGVGADMRLHAPYLPLGSLCKGPEYGATRIRTQKLGGAIEVIENKSLIFTDEKAKV